MLKRVLVLPVLLLTLPAAMCSTARQGVRVETVRVPTPVPCVDPAQVPAEPAQVGGQLNGDAAHDVSVVSASALELRKWGRSLRALIVPGCTTAPAPKD